ncbi:MAG: S41 family peptidase [Defluviitaleaceae bacterium]|nr:S41 family peptidase [Defluviitaleaceae bacterium]
MRKLKSAAVALALILVMAMPAAAFAQPTPQEMGLIPIRAFFEDIGGTTEWQSEDRSIHIAIDGGTVVLFPGQTAAYTNGVAITLQDGVSLRQNIAFISENDLILLLTHFLETLSGDGALLTFYLTEEARDIVLYDFDYMVNAILENSPWASVLDRAALNQIELDFAAFTSIFRGFIEAMEPIQMTVLDEAMLRTQFPIQDGDDARSIAANYLFAALAFEFAPPLMGIGHLGVRTLDVYTALLTANLRQYYDETHDSENNLLLQMFIEAYTHPSAVWLYGEVEVDLNADILDAFPSVPGNIVTEILVPYEVAFLRINSFLANPLYDDLVILPFLQEVQDFNHLILDVRGNRGGLEMYFNEIILRRLINEPVEIGTREFFSGGDLAAGIMDAALQTMLYMESAFDWQEVVSAEIVPIGDFLAENNMPYFNRGDLASLDYVLLSLVEIAPAYDSINFGGKVWLLVDGMSMSASVLAAETMIYTGLATIVGENTSGVMGSSHVYIALPNTGIIWRIDIGYRTDALGRSLEVNGIAPHIRNFEDMDALETVLALIAGGYYE